MHRGWGTLVPLPPLPSLKVGFILYRRAGSLLREAVVEGGAQQVVEQQDGPAPQFKLLPPGHALSVAQEAQTRVRRGHN